MACFETPKAVAEALKAEFGVTITPQGAEAYDPTKRSGQCLSAHLRKLFEHTRADFLRDMSDHVPESHKAVRVKRLARAANALEARGNWVGMADMLERIAKEMGNVHTNRREYSGRGGGSIAFSELSDEQLNAQISELLGNVPSA